MSRLYEEILAYQEHERIGWFWPTEDQLYAEYEAQGKDGKVTRKTDW